MIEIPKQLQNKDFNFVLLGKKSKIPFEENWQNKEYQYNNEKLLEHISKENNYGVIGGYGNLRIIDIDNKDEAKNIIKKFNTFTVKTGSGNGIHIYIKSNYEKNHIFKNGKGELRSKNYQVVGCNSIHPSGKKYEIINDSEIKFIDKKELLEILNHLITKTKEFSYKKQIEKTKVEIEKEILPKLNDFTKTLIIRDSKEYDTNFYGFPSRSERDQKIIVTLLLKGFGQYIKSIFEQFPIGDKYKEHSNPNAYLKKNIEKAREYSGISEDLSIALEEEINELSERILRNKIDYYLEKISKLNKWSEIKYLIGLIAFKTKISKSDLEKRINYLIENSNKDQHFFSVDEILNLEIPEVEFYIENLIPKKSLIIIQGKPGQFKSLFTLLICLSLKSKKSFLNKFEIKEIPRIIYYDLENEIGEIKRRIQYGLKGLNSKKETIAKNFHFEKNFKKLNQKLEIEKCKDFDLIVLDSYRRFIEGDENKAEIINKFYSDFLKPLLNSGKTIIIIAHEKKGNYENFNYEGGRMEMLRGSSDFEAQPDLILALTKLSETKNLKTNNRTLDLNLSIVKNRKGLNLEDFNFQVEKNDQEKATLLKFIREGKPPKPKERLINKIIDFIESKTEVQRSEIVDYIIKLYDYSEPTIDRILKEMINKNLINQPKYGIYSVFKESDEKNQQKSL